MYVQEGNRGDQLSGFVLLHSFNNLTSAGATFLSMEVQRVDITTNKHGVLLPSSDATVRLKLQHED